MFRFWFSSRGRCRREVRDAASRSSHAIMSISRQAAREESEPYHDSLNFVVAAEYLARTERLFSRLRPRARPTPALLPEYRLAYESPQNLALELTKSILYENTDSIDALKSIHSGDTLWNGKPQQYFESMNYAADAVKEYDSDSLAQC